MLDLSFDGFCFFGSPVKTMDAENEGLLCKVKLYTGDCQGGFLRRMVQDEKSQNHRTSISMAFPSFTVNGS
jgi:hypothetical protein